MWSFEKVDLGGYDEISIISRPKFTGLFCRTREKSRSMKHLSDFEYLHLFRRYSLSKFEVVRNRAKFCIFLAPKFFGGKGPSKFWTGMIKSNTVPSTVQNFAAIGRRSWEITKEKKKCQQNVSPLRKLSLLGRLIRQTGFIT